MAKKPRKKKAKQSPQYGEDYLASFDEISLRLENGQEVTFKMEDELCIPTDPLIVVVAHRQSPSRLAFWSAQADRAMLAVRKAERALAEVEAGVDMSSRKYVQEDTEFNVTEKIVQDYVDLHSDVRKARIKYDAARKQFDLLRTMRTAMERRDFTLGRIYNAQEVTATRV
jgi:hypothetical protein